MSKEQEDDMQPNALSGAPNRRDDFEDDIHLHSAPCPHCHAGYTHSRDCTSCGGEGFHEMYDDDPVYYDEGDVELCGDCGGMGFHHWCRACGYDLIEKRIIGA